MIVEANGVMDSLTCRRGCNSHIHDIELHDDGTSLRP